jgi:hypothetical protein
MSTNEFDWGSGRVTYWDMHDLDPSVPLSQQSDRLKEDLAQIEYRDGTLIDIGWYPSFSPEGSFVVQVVRPGWTEVLYSSRCTTFEQLLERSREAVAFAEKTKH